MKTFDVITVGSALKDIMFFTEEGGVKAGKIVSTLTLEFDRKYRTEKVNFGFGGGAANTSVNFSGLGLRTSSIFSVGDDEDGENILRFFKRRGIDTTNVRTDKKHHTGFSLLLIHEKEGDHVVFTHYGAAANMPTTRKAFSGAQSSWWYVTSLNNTNWKSTIRAIAAQPGKLAWNPGGSQLEGGFKEMKDLLSKVAVLFLNKSEAIRLVKSHSSYKREPDKSFAGIRGGRKLVNIIQEWGPEIVVVTEGNKGIFARAGDTLYNKKPPTDNPVDTTGAGDSFGSTFIAVLHKTGDIEKALKGAQVNTTSVVHKIGAQEGFLSWAALKRKARL